MTLERERADTGRVHTQGRIRGNGTQRSQAPQSIDGLPVRTTDRYIPGDAGTVPGDSALGIRSVQLTFTSCDSPQGCRPRPPPQSQRILRPCSTSSADVVALQEANWRFGAGEIGDPATCSKSITGALRRPVARAGGGMRLARQCDPVRRGIEIAGAEPIDLAARAARSGMRPFAVEGKPLHVVGMHPCSGIPTGCI